MSTLVSCLAGSDSKALTPLTVFTMRIQMWKGRDSREKLYLENHYLLFFFHCHFSVFETRKYPPHRNLNKTRECVYHVFIVWLLNSTRHECQSSHFLSCSCIPSDPDSQAPLPIHSGHFPHASILNSVFHP